MERMLYILRWLPAITHEGLCSYLFAVVLIRFVVLLGTIWYIVRIKHVRRILLYLTYKRSSRYFIVTVRTFNLILEPDFYHKWQATRAAYE